MTRATRPIGIAVLVAAAVVVSARAHAQSAQDKVAAEALFDQGRKLLSEGKFGEACPKFAESQRLDPAPGTLLNLADCYEKNGQTATAWVHFREAASAASAAGDERREGAARSRAAALEATLSRLTVSVPPRADVAGLEIKLDGTLLGKPSWGTATPVDPGAHTIEAKAPGKKSWTTKVTVGPKGATATVAIPSLVDEGSAETPPPVAPPAETPTTGPRPDPGGPPPVAPDEGGSGSSQRVLALVAGGVGVVGVGLGAAFGLMANSKNSDSEGHCREGNLCDQEGVDLRDSALTAATVSTIAFAVGAAGLVGGAVLWFTAPTRSKTAHAVQIVPAVGASSTGAFVRGSF